MRNTEELLRAWKAGEDLTDEELEVLDIQIPEDETDGSFFDEIDKMIEDVFKEDAP